jgi:hypothetical protein
VKDFTAAAGRLRSLSLGAKMLYTAFAFSAVVGLLVSWRLYGIIVADAGPSAYYAGAMAESRKEPDGATVDTGPGPELDLPKEAKAPHVLVERISERKLLEVTHFHLFSIPVYVLILAHLWVLSRLPSWLHSAGVIAAIVTSGVHIAAPWLVRDSPGTARLLPISGALMLATLSIMACVSTVDMWLPRRRPDPR